jgi:nucleoside-diphosphate-sugar epimerase
MQNKMKVLVSGGAGYIGSVLVRLLLQAGREVRVMDNLRYGGDTLVELFNNPNFDFQKGDVRDEADLRRALDGIEAVVHLAAIVGDPACAREPELARETNFLATRTLYELAEQHGVKRFVYASTCSNYGRMKDGSAYLDETSELAPVSLYAETKVESERFLLSQPKTNPCRPTCLRFSTVYGLSPRIRFDLTVNEFTRELAMGRELVIFGEQFWRPYCHVLDLARAVLAVLDAPEKKVAFQVFNVGDTAENYQKRMLAGEILKFIPDGRVRYVHKDEDLRDYRVSFEKIKKTLGFRISKRVPDGIEQVIRVIRDKVLADPDDPKYRNT